MLFFIFKNNSDLMKVLHSYKKISYYTFSQLPVYLQPLKQTCFWILIP